MSLLTCLPALGSGPVPCLPQPLQLVLLILAEMSPAPAYGLQSLTRGCCSFLVGRMTQPAQTPEGRPQPGEASRQRGSSPPFIEALEKRKFFSFYCLAQSSLVHDCTEGLKPLKLAPLCTSGSSSTQVRLRPGGDLSSRAGPVPPLLPQVYVPGSTHADAGTEGLLETGTNGRSGGREK